MPADFVNVPNLTPRARNEIAQVRLDDNICYRHDRIDAFLVGSVSSIGYFEPNRPGLFRFREADHFTPDPSELSRRIVGNVRGEVKYFCGTGAD